MTFRLTWLRRGRHLGRRDVLFRGHRPSRLSDRRQHRTFKNEKEDYEAAIQHDWSPLNSKIPCFGFEFGSLLVGRVPGLCGCFRLKNELDLGLRRSEFLLVLSVEYCSYRGKPQTETSWLCIRLHIKN